ncbi:MAG TPA: HAMP domain-containing sensor histidine kinase [Gemmatimonadaceae bacterium]|jgi:signal transduction histidine kinase|nr:HAMP domain-containing sensor histidine kinase [Gemmatimonadaceae bacterium]
MNADRVESRLHASLQRFPGAALEISASGIVLESNGRLELLVGRDVLGCSFGDLLDSTSQRKWLRLLETRDSMQESELWELVLKGTEGFELRTFAAVWASELGAQSFWMLEYSRDVRLEAQFEKLAAANSALLDTQRELAKERGRLNRAFAAEASARAEAEQAVRVRDEVLAIVAHDLRSPLDRIVSSSLMLQESLSDEARDKLVAVVERTARGMNRLLGDLLDASSIDAGRLSIDLQRVDVTTLIDQSVDAYAREASAKGVSLTWSVAPDVPAILADGGRVQQTLANLVGNAVRLTRPPGHVTVNVVLADGAVRFIVSDSGPGISSAELPHVFERFWQAKSKRRGGAGLGLAIARGIVEAHGGQIHAESELGIGSTFSFTIPTNDRA